MNTYITHLRVPLTLGTILFLSIAIPGRTEEPTATKVVAGSSFSDLQVQGIMRSKPASYVSFAIGGRGLGTWLQEGEEFSHYHIKEIGPNSVVVTDLTSGVSQELRLRQSAVTNSGESAASGPAPYSKAWINSKANPMVYRTLPLPTEVGRNWSKLTQAERDDIIALYLKHGWKLFYSENSSGSTSFTWENIYSKERHDVISENNRAFAATLSTDQQKVWSEISRTAPLMVKAGAPTPEQLAEVARRRAVHDSFVASLTPSQAAAYSTKDDFTNADWSKPTGNPIH